MWPWGHVGFGYLLYSIWCRRHGKRPQSPEVFLVVLGTLLPDLVDKPLAWTLNVLDSGRSLGHSILIALLVIGILYHVVAPRIGRSQVTAFAIGYLSHPIGDLPFTDLLAGNVEYASYLLWPLLPAPTYETEQTFIAHFIQLSSVGTFDVLQVTLAISALSVWYFDGLPGLNRTRTALWDCQSSKK